MKKMLTAMLALMMTAATAQDLGPTSFAIDLQWKNSCAAEARRSVEDLLGQPSYDIQGMPQAATSLKEKGFVNAVVSTSGFGGKAIYVAPDLRAPGDDLGCSYLASFKPSGLPGEVKYLLRQ